MANRDFQEARVTINGRTLTPAQVLTLRVALTGFLHELAEPDFMQDLGPIGPAYQARGREVETMLVEGGG